jgi:heme/copper-type cytochrome/quinol oxidase subunit 2
MAASNVVISVLCTVILILLGINLYFNWKCNKDTSNNDKIFNIMPSNTFRNNLNVFSALIITMMWIYCLFSFNSGNTNRTNGANGANGANGSDTST